jgi:hypothetical protein
MKPLPVVGRFCIAGLLLGGLSLPARAETTPPETLQPGAFGSGWVHGQEGTAPMVGPPSSLPYGSGYEQRHSQRTTTTWSWPTPAANPGRSATGGGRSGQGGGNGGGGRGR